jgi:hypothetical protein
MAKGAKTRAPFVVCLKGINGVGVESRKRWQDKENIAGSVWSLTAGGS